MNNLKECLIAILMVFVSLIAVAQHSSLPVSGIYKLEPDGDNILSLSDYAGYIGAINSNVQSFTVNIFPNKVIQKYNINYALVSLDTKGGKGKIKIAFLRDTISRLGKKVDSVLSAKYQLYNTRGPALSQEFSIDQDTVSELIDDPHFPVNFNIGGKWHFNDYNNSLAFINEQPEVKSVDRYDSILEKDIHTRIFNFGQSMFYGSDSSLVSFCDLLYTYGVDSIPVYTDSTAKSTIKTWFRHGEYIGVLMNDFTDWLLVMRIVITPDSLKNGIKGEGTERNTTTCQSIIGWIKKSDLER